MEQGKKWRQFLAAILSNLSSVVIGTCLGWTSAAESKMKDVDQSPLSSVPTTEEFSWISSLTPLGALVGPYIAGPLTSRIGRKWTLLFSSAFFLASFIILFFAETVALVFVARILQGLGVGLVTTAQTMYVGEISSDESRGALGSFMQLGIVIGILYVYSVGPFVNFQTYQCLCMIIPIIFTGTFFFMPDSPHYYIQKGDEDAAVKSLKYLRGKSTEGIQEELDTIRSTVEESMRHKGTVRDVFANKANKKAFIISAGLLSFQQLSGINVVLFFCQSIFETAGSSLEPAIATIIVGVVMVFSSGLTPVIVGRLGRKVILLFSAAGMVVAHVFLGLFFLLDHNKSPIAESIKWLPIVSLIAFVFFYCVGFGPLPWVMLGEMFSPSIKPIASSMATSVCWICAFIVTKYFALLQDVLGSYGAFWFFDIFCVMAFVFTLTFVMETKGLSLQEIQDHLNGH